jgi:hypothetical protein
MLVQVKHFLFGSKTRILVTFFVVFLILVAALTALFLKPESPGKENNKFTFKVVVPNNTPEQDNIHILITDIPPHSKELKMEKVGSSTYEISFSQSDLGQAYDFPKIKYRYDRNGMGFTTAEYLPEGIKKEPKIAPEDEEGSSFAYRVTTFEEGKVQEDKIKRWRWFPEGKIVKEDISALGPTGKFLERVGGRKFLSGVGVEDLYVPQMDPFFDVLANRVKEKGYNFVVLYPPLQMKEVGGKPKIVNDLENNPNYPNDEKLIEHISAFKKKGLKVFMEPQVCCEANDTSNKSTSWWDTYIKEATAFLVQNAKVAEKSGVDALLFDTYNIDQEMSGYSQKMQTMFNEAKKYYKGEMFAKVVPFLPEGTNSPKGFIPDLDRMSWADDVDFFVYDAEGELSPKSNPTKAELAEGAGKLIDLTKTVYDTFGKPVLVRSSYFAVKQSWKSTPFYQSIVIPAEEKYDLGYAKGGELSTYDQARVDNAFFEAISKRPWVIGFVHFGYYHWDMPTLPHWSIRGRVAEDVWVKWNDFIFNK